MIPALSALWLGSSDAWATDPCKYAMKGKKDAFHDPATVVTTGAYPIKLVDGKAVMSMRISTGSVSKDPIEPGFEVQWHLSNGTKITFYNAEVAEPASGVFANQYAAGAFTNWTLTMPLSWDAIQAVAQSRPDAFRYKLGASENSGSFSNVGSLGVQRDFACIANHLDARDGVEAAVPDESPPSDSPGPAAAKTPSEVTEVEAEAEDDDIAGPKSTGKSKKASSPARPVLITVGAVGLAAAGGALGYAAVQRSAFLDAPSESGFNAVNRAYWASVGLGALGAGLTTIGIAGRF